MDLEKVTVHWAVMTTPYNTIQYNTIQSVLISLGGRKRSQNGWWQKLGR